MKIAFLCSGDMAGVMYNLSEAVNRHTRHEAFHVTRSSNPTYRFPYGYKMNAENMKELHGRIYGSDAIVFAEWMGICEKLKLNKKALRKKIIAVTYGGGGFRLRRARVESMNYYGNIRSDVKYIACSADFLEREPLPWVPRVVRTQWLRDIYDHSKLEPPLIAASPSFSTDGINRQMGYISVNFNRIAGRLKAYKKMDFQARLISSSKSGMSNDECLKIKAHSSAFFDRLYSIYGVNSLEAAAFGAAVITGTSQPALDVIKRHLGMDCPFIIRHTWEGVESAFVELLRNPDYMRQKGGQCLKYVEALEKYAANRMVKILGG